MTKTITEVLSILSKTTLKREVLEAWIDDIMDEIDIEMYKDSTYAITVGEAIQRVKEHIIE